MFEKATSLLKSPQLISYKNKSFWLQACSVNTALVPPSTINDKSVAWLKFGEFCKFAYFAKLNSFKT